MLLNSCHPGDPCTTLSCALGYNTTATKDCTRAAALPSFLALSPVVAEHGWSGRWFSHGQRPSICSFGGAGRACTAEREALFQLLESYSVGSVGDDSEKK